MDLINPGTKWSVPLVIAAACGLLAACGGGSGSSEQPAPPEATVVTKAVMLDGAQESPAVDTAGVGSGSFTFNLETGEATGTVTTVGIRVPRVFLEEGSADSHGARVAELFNDPPASGEQLRWSLLPNTILTPAQIESLKAGNLHVNVVSAAHGTGEIRGQVGRTVLFATLDAAQQAAGAASPGMGSGRFALDPQTRKLAGTLATTGIAATSAELHAGGLGVSGATVVALAGGPNQWSVPDGTTLDASQADAFVHGAMYVVVATADRPAGEIRGQLFLPHRVAKMNGAQETPPVATNDVGTCTVMVNPATRIATTRIDTSLFAEATAAHVHSSIPEQAAREAIGLRPAQGAWISDPAPIDQDMLASFMAGQLFCDVHTVAHPDGEIRGPLVDSAP